MRCGNECTYAKEGGEAQVKDRRNSSRSSPREENSPISSSTRLHMRNLRLEPHLIFLFCSALSLVAPSLVSVVQSIPSYHILFAP